MPKHKPKIPGDRIHVTGRNHTQLRVDGREFPAIHLSNQKHPQHGQVDYYGAVESSGRRKTGEGAQYKEAHVHPIFMKTPEMVVPVDWEMRELINHTGQWDLHPKPE